MHACSSVHIQRLLHCLHVSAAYACTYAHNSHLAQHQSKLCCCTASFQVMLACWRYEWVKANVNYTCTCDIKSQVQTRFKAGSLAKGSAPSALFPPIASLLPVMLCRADMDIACLTFVTCCIRSTHVTCCRFAKDCTSSNNA